MAGEAHWRTLVGKDGVCPEEVRTLQECAVVIPGHAPSCCRESGQASRSPAVVVGEATSLREKKDSCRPFLNRGGIPTRSLASLLSARIRGHIDRW